MNDFREKTVALLNKNNMTQKELANRVGITEASMSRYIRGNRTPKGTVISNIANVLHTTTDYLLGSEAKGNESYCMNQNIILKSIVYYGKEIQLTVCMEECAELIQAISKAKRGKLDEDNMTEEIADVLICIEMLKQIYNIPDCSIENWIERKQERMLRRMEV
jgi:transcriptional regulator with XRE-family HTH domain